LIGRPFLIIVSSKSSAALEKTLEAGIQERNGLLIFVLKSPTLDDVRHEPFFREITRKVGLPL
jgi:hypothetical protein